MRLVELAPRWIELDGEKVGFVFKSPTDQRWYQSCFFRKLPFREQCKLLQTLGLTTEGFPSNVQTCNPDCAWTWVSGTSFEDITVTPSLDGSKGGLWHGCITKGNIE
ncbi:MAG TPA: hypothetical protein VLE97_01945 [Gaiellaceae bacterium]|nr:hypothetical protein [Gaiellaceae bacterium]